MHFQERLASPIASVVDDDGQRAKRGDAARHRRLGTSRRGEVLHDDLRFAAGTRSFLGTCFVDIDERDGAAPGGQRDGGSAAKAATSPSDHGSLHDGRYRRSPQAMPSLDTPMPVRRDTDQ